MVRNTLHIGKCESGRATVCLAKWPVRQGQNFHNDLEAANMVLGYFKRFKTRGETYRLLPPRALFMMTLLV